MADNSQTKKKGFSVKDALFGGSGSSGSLYKIIYFSISGINTDKGFEQRINIVYGDERAIFTNSIPLMSAMFVYNDEVDGPYIKLGKSFIPGSSKAEILLPVGYSFMAPSVPHFIDAMPKVVAASKEDDEYEEPALNTDDVLRMVNQAEADVIREKEERMIREQKEKEAAEEAKKNQKIDNADTKYIEPTKKPKPKKIHEEPAVIEDGTEFIATFDSEALSAKIDKFMDKHGADKKKVELKPIQDVDPRTIGEVKKASVDDEMERLFKNEDQFKKLGQDANEDVKNAMDAKKGNKQ